MRRLQTACPFSVVVEDNTVVGAVADKPVVVVVDSIVAVGAVAGGVVAGAGVDNLVVSFSLLLSVYSSKSFSKNYDNGSGVEYIKIPIAVIYKINKKRIKLKEQRKTSAFRFIRLLLRWLLRRILLRLLRWLLSRLLVVRLLRWRLCLLLVLRLRTPDERVKLQVYYQ
jgi:hypothetical protein